MSFYNFFLVSFSYENWGKIIENTIKPLYDQKLTITKCKLHFYHEHVKQNHFVDLLLQKYCLLKEWNELSIYLLQWF